MADHMAVQVTMYLTEGDSWHHRSLHLEILKYLREENVAGAAVRDLRGSRVNRVPLEYRVSLSRTGRQVESVNLQISRTFLRPMRQAIKDRLK
jgi:hypothetical protein